MFIEKIHSKEHSTPSGSHHSFVVPFFYKHAIPPGCKTTNI